jgi:large subunit ribosomal protein L35
VCALAQVGDTKLQKSAVLVGIASLAGARDGEPVAGANLLYLAAAMPKMKTHSGSKKRFKTTGTGKLRARHAMSSHILEKKSPKRKRHHGNPVVISDADAPRVRKLLRVGSAGK